MANPAKNGLEKGYIVPSFKFGDDLRAERVLQSEDLGPKLPQPEGGDDLHLLAVQSNAVLKPAETSLVAEVKEENTSLRQENTEIGQKLDTEKKLKKIESEVELRQLFKCFREGRHGKEIDKLLMAWIRKKSSLFDTTASDPISLEKITSFSVMVIHLVYLRRDLQKEKEDTNLSPDRLREIKSKIIFINSRLSILKTFAREFKDTEKQWDRSTGEGFYSWCLLVADANEMCHPDMSEERFKNMRKNAAKREYKFEEVLNTFIKINRWSIGIIATVF